MTITAAAVIVGCSRQTGSKWVNRLVAARGWRIARRVRIARPAGVRRGRAGGAAGAQLSFAEGPHVIGWATGVPASTVHAILRRHGCSRSVPRPAREEIIRYQRDRPGELVHIDAKKLGRIIRPGHRVTGDRRHRAKGKAGWQHLFVAIDDATRLAYAELYPDETNASSDQLPGRLPSLLRRSTASPSNESSPTTAPASNGAGRKPARAIQIAVQTDATLPPADQRQGRAFHPHLARPLGLRHSPTPPNTTEHAPSQTRIDTYNRNRPHRALGGRTPLQRVNDLSGTNT